MAQRIRISTRSLSGRRSRRGPSRTRVRPRRTSQDIARDIGPGISRELFENSGRPGPLTRELRNARASEAAFSNTVGAQVEREEALDELIRLSDPAGGGLPNRTPGTLPDRSPPGIVTAAQDVIDEISEDIEVRDILGGPTTAVAPPEGAGITEAQVQDRIDALIQQQISDGADPQTPEFLREEALRLIRLAGGEAVDDTVIKDFIAETEGRRDQATVDDALREAVISDNEEAILDATQDKLELEQLEKTIEDTVEQAERLGRELERQKAQAERAGEALDLELADLTRGEDIVNEQLAQLQDQEDRAEAAIARKEEDLDIGLQRSLDQANKELADIARADESAGLDTALALREMGVAQKDIDAAFAGIDVERSDLEVARRQLEVRLAGQGVKAADLDEARASLGTQLAGLDVDEANIAVARKALALKLAKQGVAQAEIDAATAQLGAELAGLETERAEVNVARASLDRELAGHQVERSDLDVARAELGEAIAGLSLEQQDLIVAKRALGTRLSEQGVEQAQIDEAQAALGAELAQLTFSEKEIDRSLTRIERAKLGAIRKAKIAARSGQIRAAQAANAGAQGGFGASSAIAGLQAQFTVAAATAAGDMLTQLVDFGLKETSLHDELGVLDARGDVLSASGEVLLSREDLLMSKRRQLGAEFDSLLARGRLLTTKATTLTKRGQSIDDRGRLIDAKGNVISAREQALDVRGDAIDSREEALNARGDILDAQGNVLEAQGDLIGAEGDALDAQGNVILARRDAADARQETIDASAVQLAAEADALAAQGTAIDARGNLVDARGDTILSRQELIEAQEEALLDRAELQRRGFEDATDLLENIKQSLIDERALEGAEISDKRDAIRDEFDLLGTQLDDAKADIADDVSQIGMDRADLQEALDEIATRENELGTDKEEDIQFLVNTFDLGGNVMEAKGALDRAAAAQRQDDADRAQLISAVSTGAAIGTAIMPGVGTVAGAAIGGILASIGVL